MDAYIRVSQLGDRDEDESTEVYEAQVREWADRNGEEIDEVVEDTNVSGSTAVSKRGLESLVQRVVDGESEGIVTPYLDRFGRDLIEGAVALKKITEAGGKLVAVRDGFDSTSPGSKLVFNLRMSIAEDFLQRSKDGWAASRKRAGDRGVYLAARPPFGYRKDPDSGRLVVDERAAPIVKEIFKRRAKGANLAELMRWHRAQCEKEDIREPGGKRKGEVVRITKTGITSILRNRAYLGEMRNGKTMEDHHPRIITDKQWEAAQVKPAVVTRNGATKDARLRGLVHCATCGSRCKTGASGPKGKRKSQYVCVDGDCKARASMRATLLDDHVEALLMQAAADHEPHVEVVILGDTRYQDAMAAVEKAREAFDEFRDSVELQRELGVKDFAAGLKVRKDALNLARRELSKTPSGSDDEDNGKTTYESFEEIASERDRYDREVNARFVDRVVVKPAGIERRGNPPPPEERADVYFAGADKPWQPTYAKLTKAQQRAAAP